MGQPELLRAGGPPVVAQAPLVAGGRGAVLLAVAGAVLALAGQGARPRGRTLAAVLCAVVGAVDGFPARPQRRPIARLLRLRHARVRSAAGRRAGVWLARLGSPSHGAP